MPTLGDRNASRPATANPRDGPATPRPPHSSRPQADGLSNRRPRDRQIPHPSRRPASPSPSSTSSTLQSAAAAGRPAHASGRGPLRPSSCSSSPRTWPRPLPEVCCPRPMLPDCSLTLSKRVGVSAPTLSSRASVVGLTRIELVTSSLSGSVSVAPSDTRGRFGMQPSMFVRAAPPMLPATAGRRLESTRHILTTCSSRCARCRRRLSRRAYSVPTTRRNRVEQVGPAVGADHPHFWAPTWTNAALAAAVAEMAVSFFQAVKLMFNTIRLMWSRRPGLTRRPLDTGGLASPAPTR